MTARFRISDSRRTDIVTLYYSPGACSLAPHIVLEWIGEPYRAQKVDHHDPEFIKINPAGAVPALDYGGAQPLTQCAAVLHYLARKHPEANLMDDSSTEAAAELERWSAFITGDLHPSFFPIYFPARYTVSTDPAAQEDVRSAAIELVRSKLKLLERQMTNRLWIVGGKRTILDAYVTPMLNWSTSLIPGGLDDFPAAKAHRAWMLNNAAVRKVMADEGIG